MHLEGTCTGCNNNAINGIKDLGLNAMLLSDTYVTNNEKENFIKCRTMTQINEKIEKESEGIQARLENMEKRLTALVDEKVENAIKPHAKNWNLTGFLKILQMKVRSLINLERRLKFANAIATSNYDIICLCETWLNENIASSELMLNEYSIYRSERQTAKDQNLHSGVLMAVKQTFSSKLLPKKHPECCLICSIQINDKRRIVCCFFNPPSSSKYRYCLSDFAQILNEIEKSNQSTATLNCGDVNFPNANWIDYGSTENEENSIIELIEKHQFEQAIDFPTCGKNLLDVTLFENCPIHATPDESFSKIYNCSDHKAISILLECPHHEVKVAIEKIRSFGSVDYNEIKKSILSGPFSQVCHTNINRMCEELYDYFRKFGKPTCGQKNETSSITSAMDYAKYLKHHE